MTQQIVKPKKIAHKIKNYQRGINYIIKIIFKLLKICFYSFKINKINHKLG